MKKHVLMVTTDNAFGRGVQDALAESDYMYNLVNSVENLLKRIQSGEEMIVLLDLDALALDNTLIKAIVRKNAKTVLIGASSRKFHPDLKEALSRHIFACVAKPIDMEELQYLLKGIVDEADHTNL